MMIRRYISTLALMPLLLSCSLGSLINSFTPPLCPPHTFALNANAAVISNGTRQYFIPDQSFMVFSKEKDRNFLRLSGVYLANESKKLTKIELHWINGITIDLKQNEDQAASEVTDCKGIPAYEIQFLDISKDSFVQKIGSEEKLFLRRRSQPFRVVFDCKDQVISQMQNRGWFYILNRDEARIFDLNENLLHQSATPTANETDVTPGPPAC